MFGLLGGIGGKIIGALLIVGVLGGAYAWVTTGAYNRGVAATEKRMVEIIAKQKRAVLADAERLRALPPEALDEELRKLCRAHGGGEACK